MSTAASPLPTSIGERLRAASLFSKLLALVAIGIFIVAAALTVLSARSGRDLAVSSKMQMAARVTESFAESSLTPLRFGAIADLQASVDRLIADFDGSLASVAIVDDTGGVIVQGGEVSGPAVALAGEAQFAEVFLTGADALTVAAPILTDEGGARGAVVMKWSDDKILADLTRDGLINAAIAGIIALCTLILGGVLLHRMISTRMVALTDSMDRISGGDLASEVPGLDKRDDIGRIAQNLDTFRLKLLEAKELQTERERAARSQEKVVEAMSVALDALARGDLRQTLSDDLDPAYDGLRTAYNQTIGTLRDMIGQITMNAERIRNGVDGIAAASDELSRRTESQAATLVQSVAALEELSVSVKSVADRSQEVRDAMEITRKQARDSVDVVGDAVTAMGEIKDSSDRISQIISVIDDIAFQTNLLALNAGVEAARAGDAGRGFAVVASEVRALAQRSSEAAKEIETLIRSSATQVERGVDLVARTGSALEGIAEQVSVTTDHVIANAGAAAEQATGLNEINLGVTELDSVTQQNAAMVEQSTAACHELKAEAAELGELITRFRIEAEEELVDRAA